MTIPSLGALVTTPGRGHWHWHLPTRRRRERAAVLAQNLTLASAGTGVPLPLVENDPMLMHLAVEDLCWRLELADLGRRRPRRGDQAARDAWLTERQVLEAERRRLAAKVTETIGTL